MHTYMPACIISAYACTLHEHLLHFLFSTKYIYITTYRLNSETKMTRHNIQSQSPKNQMPQVIVFQGLRPRAFTRQCNTSKHQGGCSMRNWIIVRHHPLVCLQSVHLMSSHLTKSPMPSLSYLDTNCKSSNIGGGNGLGMRQSFTVHCIKLYK